MGKGGGCVLSKNKVPPVLENPPNQYGVTTASIPIEGNTPDAHANSAAAAATPEMVPQLPVTQEPKYRYDVFLSFRGEDTLYGFTGNLHDALCRKGFDVFMDDEILRGGELISPALLTAIEESRISIVVLSENYASSTWCLDELVKILECWKQTKQHVLPIFYKVQPSDVRHQRNKYEEAMTAHENRFRNDLEKVHTWRSALREASNLSGFELNNSSGYEHEFIKRIAKRVSDLLPNHLYIEVEHVGLKSRVEEVMSLLDIKSTDTVRMVGIHGTGGIGKTTLAKALYDLIVNQFEGACYLANVRETSNQHVDLVHLQETILSKVFMDYGYKLSNDDEGASMIKKRLCHLRVLLVLDDVDNIRQLRKLAGECDWFGPGSRIIITTRNKHLLIAHQVENRFEMKVLNDQDSLKLFCWNAFKMSRPKTNYEDLSNHAIRYAKGLPLALEVIGSNLNGKDVDEWKCALNKYEKSPHKDIQSILRISYDSLDCTEKDLFLDIACFFKGQKVDYVESILDACDFSPKYFIGELVDKSLISIEGRELSMHDLIQDMGKEVVRQEAPSKPGLRSRLWFHEDVIEVLNGNSGSRNIEGIILDPPQQEEIEWSGTAFEKMDNLRILIIKRARFSQAPTHLPNSLRLLDWEEYPSESFPPGFNPRKIVVFNLRHSRLRLAEPFRKYEYLTTMDFSYCEVITQIPDMSGVPNIRELRLENCGNLVEVHKSVGYLNKLVSLDVSHCINLTSFPREIQMTSLESIYLEGCIRLDHFPHILGKMDALTCIKANDTAIEKLPHSIGNLTRLSQLEMRSDVKHIRELPRSLFMLQNLHSLVFKPSTPHIRKSIRKCLRQLSFQFYRKFPKESLRQVKSMQESHSAVICGPKLSNLTLPNCGLLDADLYLILTCFLNLEMLFLSGNDFVSLPPCIAQLHKLRLLDVSDCKKLRDIPEIPSNWKKIKAQNCASLTTESSSRLWSQVLKEVRELEITMPQTPIPDWFDHGCMGGTLSFSIKGKFPLVALAFTVGKAPPVAVGEVVNEIGESSRAPTLPLIEGLDAESHKKLFVIAKNMMSQLQRQRELISRIKGVEDEKPRGLHVEVSLFVNGRPVINSIHTTSLILYSSSDPIVEGNALVWTPRGSLEEEGWQKLDALLAHDDWNDVVIQAKCTDSSSLAVNYCAVYVCKPQTNMDDIQFKCFDPNNNSTMVSMTWEPIKLTGSQDEQQRLYVEGMFGAI